MFKFFLFLIPAAMIFGVARGATQLPSTSDTAKVVAWAIAAALWVGLFLWIEPFQSTESTAQRSPAETRELRLAMQKCDERVLSVANHPRSVSFSTLNTTRAMRDGAAVVRRGFSAQNSYGAELKHEYLCFVRNGEITLFEIN